MYIGARHFDGLRQLMHTKGWHPSLSWFHLLCWWSNCLHGIFQSHFPGHRLHPAVLPQGVATLHAYCQTGTLGDTKRWQKQEKVKSGLPDVAELERWEN